MKIIHPPARMNFSLDPNHSHLQNCKEWKSHISVISWNACNWSSVWN
jgi:hypothetical protein